MHLVQQIPHFKAASVYTPIAPAAERCPRASFQFPSGSVTFVFRLALMGQQAEDDRRCSADHHQYSVSVLHDEKAAGVFDAHRRQLFSIFSCVLRLIDSQSLSFSQVIQYLLPFHLLSRILLTLRSLRY